MIGIDISVDSNNSEITFRYFINGFRCEISDAEAELALNLYEEIQQTISSLQIPIKIAKNFSIADERAEVLAHIRCQTAKVDFFTEPSYTIELRIDLNDSTNKNSINIKHQSTDACSDREKEIAETILKKIQAKLISIQKELGITPVLIGSENPSKSEAVNASEEFLEGLASSTGGEVSKDASGITYITQAVTEIPDTALSESKLSTWNSPDGLLGLHLDKGWSPVAPNNVFRSFVGDLRTSNAGELIVNSCHSFPLGGLFGTKKLTMEVFKKLSVEPDLRAPGDCLLEIESDIEFNGRAKQIFVRVDKDNAAPHIFAYVDRSNFKVLARAIILFKTSNVQFLVCLTSIAKDLSDLTKEMLNISLMSEGITEAEKNLRFI